MPTATDQDYSVAADGGEREAIPQVVVTGVSVVDAAGGLGQGLVEFNAGKVLNAPGIGGAAGVWQAITVAQVYAGVMTPVSLPDSQLAFSSSFSYTVTLKLEGFADYQVSGLTISKNSFPSGTCDLSQLV